MNYYKMAMRALGNHAAIMHHRLDVRKAWDDFGMFMLLTEMACGVATPTCLRGIVIGVGNK